MIRGLNFFNKMYKISITEIEKKRKPKEPIFLVKNASPKIIGK